MQSTRERKIEFIESFGRNGLASAVSEMLAREGEYFLTDEQIDALASMRVNDARITQHHDMRERARAADRRDRQAVEVAA